MDSIKTKVCSECKQELPVSEFYPRKNSKIGFSCCCKACHKIRGKIAKAKINAKPKLIPDFKKCSRCGETYPAAMFVKDNDRISGLASWCKKCTGEQRVKTADHRHAHGRKYYSENKEKFKEYAKKNADRIKKNEQIRRVKNHRRLWAFNTIKNHEHRGMTVSVGLDDMHNLAKSVDNCPICNVPLKWEAGKIATNSPTLDRINNGNELRLDNIWILCHRCNTMKRDLPMKEYVEHCKLVIKKFGNEMCLNPENEISEAV